MLQRYAELVNPLRNGKRLTWIREQNPEIQYAWIAGCYSDKNIDVAMELGIHVLRMERGTHRYRELIEIEALMKKGHTEQEVLKIMGISRGDLCRRRYLLESNDHGARLAWIGNAMTEEDLMKKMR